MSGGRYRFRIRDALAPAFYARPAERVARELLGAVCVSTIDGIECAGRIVETEAYVGPHDPASHAAERVGRTKRNDAMFGAPGTAYIYRIYGVHWCLNAVTDAMGFPAAVLIRALEPLVGVEAMVARRFPTGGATPARQLCSGPGKLAQALAITGLQNLHRLQKHPLYIVHGEPVPDSHAAAGPRIGITHAADWPLRFCIRGSGWLSRGTTGGTPSAPPEPRSTR
jgi:DNA-3-methyladenine glycosylase